MEHLIKRYVPFGIITALAFSLLFTFSIKTVSAVERTVQRPALEAATASPQTTQTAREEAKIRVEENRQQIKTEIETKRAETKTRAEQIRADHFTRISEMYAKRYMAAYERLLNIQERIAQRIEAMKAAGKETASAQEALNKATPILAETLLAVEEFKISLTTLAENPTEETLRTASRQKASQAKEALKEAHQALVASIVALKPRPIETATTTPSL